jgi:hypothetical protein
VRDVQKQHIDDQLVGLAPLTVDLLRAGFVPAAEQSNSRHPFERFIECGLRGVWFSRREEVGGHLVHDAGYLAVLIHDRHEQL